MSTNPRAIKLADQIQRIVAQTLESTVKDPRLGFVTVTEVRVTGDCQHATVFYTVLGDDDERTGTAAALASAKGLIRSEVGARVGLRLTPTIEFQLDEIPQGVRSVEDALAVAAQRDAELAAQRAGAVHAGDADPYRKPVQPAADLDEAGEADDED